MQDGNHGWHHAIHRIITQNDRPRAYLELRLSDLSRRLPSKVPVRVPIQMIKKIVADAALKQAEDDESNAAMEEGIPTGIRVLDRQVFAADLLTDDDDDDY